MIRFEVKNDSVKMSVGSNNIGMTVERVAVVSGIRYEGEYEITPTNEIQVLPTQYRSMDKDIIVKPIPERYGLITYNQDKVIKVT